MLNKILINTGPSDRGWHRIQDAIICTRLYAYRHVLDLEGSRGALVLGSLIHIGLAHNYQRQKETQQGRDPDCYYTPLEAIDAAAEQFGDCATERDTAREVVTRYLATWGVEPIKIISVEDQYEALLKSKWRFTARWDLVYEDVAGRVWVMDSKSTAKLTSGSGRTYSLSGQILMAQIMGHGIWGPRFGGVRLNFLQTVPPWKLSREAPEPAPAMLGAVVDRICRAEEQIAALEASGAPPDEWPPAINEHACMTRYGPCFFFDRCCWGQ
jgi:hypothetical protein